MKHKVDPRTGFCAACDALLERSERKRPRQGWSSAEADTWGTRGEDGLPDYATGNLKLLAAQPTKGLKCSEK